MKTDYVPICPKCGSDKTIKHGKKAGVQRFRCKECKRTFIETRKRIKYTSKEKAFLSMLLNFIERLENNEHITIQEAINNIDEDKVNINNFRLIQRVSSNKAEIHCYAPKILICKEYDTITIYKIENRLTRNEKSRITKIIDDDKNSKYKKVFSEKLTQEKTKVKLRPYQLAELKRRKTSVLSHKELEEYNNYY